MVTSVNAAGQTVKVWEKKTTDTIADSIQNARDIGQIRLNYSRLNLVTTLSKNEREDWFKFNVVSPGKLRLTAVNLSAKDDDGNKTNTEDTLEDAISDYEKAIESFKAKGLRVEVYTYKNNRQTLVATNNDKQKKEYATFENMMRGTERVTQKGTYYIRVTTQDGKPVKDDQLYALQLQMGDTYKHDYMTQEMAVDHTNVSDGDIALAKAEAAYSAAASSASILNAQSAMSILSAGYNNMAMIQESSSKNKAAQLFSLLV